MAAQFAAEATLRRVHAAQKDDDMPPIEAILAPLEADLRIARQEVYNFIKNHFHFFITPLFFVFLELIYILMLRSKSTFK